MRGGSMAEGSPHSLSFSLAHTTMKETHHYVDSESAPWVRRHFEPSVVEAGARTDDTPGNLSLSALW